MFFTNIGECSREALILLPHTVECVLKGLFSLLNSFRFGFQVGILQLKIFNLNLKVVDAGFHSIAVFVETLVELTRLAESTLASNHVLALVSSSRESEGVNHILSY